MLWRVQNTDKYFLGSMHLLPEHDDSELGAHILGGHSLWATLVALVYACGLAGCGDVNNVSPPPDASGPLTIVTNSPLPRGTVNQPYATALASSGGIAPYT